LTSLQPAQVKPFEEVRGQIEKELAKQIAGRRFAELADNFNNVVYEQSDSLKPAADLVKTAPLQSGWITRASAEAPLNNPKLLAAIFSEETLSDKRNTEAIEVTPGLVIAARVIEHKPASTQPFDAVSAGLEKRLALREASRLAAAEGRRQLDALRQGNPVKITWSPPLVISRDKENKEIPAPVVRHAFRMDVAKLPAYSGLTSPQGSYVLLRVTRVQEAEGVTPEKTKALSEQLRGVLARETMAAYVASLRQQGEVTINKEQLEKKQ
jgi:peptidyl-prolyl cis-trans isomerase D